MRVGVTYYQSTQDHTGASDAQLNQEFKLFRDNGLSVIVLATFPNVLAGPTIGTYNTTVFSRFKHITMLAGQNGLKVVHNLHTWNKGTNFPAYIGNFRRCFLDPTAKTWWINLVKKFIQETDSQYTEGWQLGNEADWRNTQLLNVGLEPYYQLWKDTVDAARQYTSKPLSIRTMMYTAHLLETRVIDLFDYVALNYYEGVDSQSTPTIFAQQAARFKAMGKEVWITEFGKNTTSDTTQKAIYKKVLDMAKANGVHTAINWRWAQSPLDYSISTGYAQPRPAFQVLASYAEPPAPLDPNLVKIAELEAKMSDLTADLLIEMDHREAAENEAARIRIKLTQIVDIANSA